MSVYSTEYVPIDGLSEAAITTAVRRINPSVLDSEIPDLFARGAWSTFVNPCDQTATKLINALGPSDALARIARGDSPADIAAAMMAAGAESADLNIKLNDALPGWVSHFSTHLTLRSFERAAESGLGLLTPSMKDWLPGLSDLGAEMPVALWTKGAVDTVAAKLEQAVALTGARACTSYGESQSMEFATGLVGHGFAVIAGGGYGIDSAAHRGATAAGGTTVAALASGLDLSYPSGNANLFDRIVDANGLLISEAAPGVGPTRWRFLARGRILAAVSQATVIVEASSRSTSLDVATRAKALGRPVGAMPGPVVSPASSGTHQLIREQIATLVTDANEIAWLANA